MSVLKKKAEFAANELYKLDGRMPLITQGSYQKGRTGLTSLGPDDLYGYCPTRAPGNGHHDLDRFRNVLSHYKDHQADLENAGRRHFHQSTKTQLEFGSPRTNSELMDLKVQETPSSRRRSEVLRGQAGARTKESYTAPK